MKPNGIDLTLSDSAWQEIQDRAKLAGIPPEKYFEQLIRAAAFTFNVVQRQTVTCGFDVQESLTGKK